MDIVLPLKIILRYTETMKIAKLKGFVPVLTKNWKGSTRIESPTPNSTQGD